MGLGGFCRGRVGREGSRIVLFLRVVVVLGVNVVVVVRVLRDGRVIDGMGRYDDSCLAFGYREIVGFGFVLMSDWIGMRVVWGGVSTHCITLRFFGMDTCILFSTLQCPGGNHGSMLAIFVTYDIQVFHFPRL